MKRILAAIVFVAFLMVLWRLVPMIVGCGNGPVRGPRMMGMMGGKGMMGNKGMMEGMDMTRHRFVMQHGIAPQYHNTRSPYADPATMAQAGKALYLANCAVCHGQQGRGDGPAAAGLTPKPANIARFVRMPMASDDYLLWTISEGGKPVGSAMPAFKTTLSLANRWKVIAWLHQM